MTSFDARERKIRINSEHGVFAVDGTDLAGSIAAAEIELIAPRRAEVVLHLAANHTLDLEALGLVRVAADSQADLIGFLASVDPQRLESAALARAEEGSLTSVMLDVLREWAVNQGA